MKYLVYTFFLTLVFLSGKDACGQQDDLSFYIFHFDNEFKAWTKTISDFQLSSFKSSDTIAFENVDFNDVKNLKHFYSIYKPALTFSKDSTKFIDIYSYELNLEKHGNKIIYSGSEVDQTISLCDIKTKRWTRILFCGYSLRVQEATWLTDTKFMLAGSIQNDESKHLPVIYIGDLTKKSFEIYSSNNPNCHQRETYNSPNFPNLIFGNNRAKSRFRNKRDQFNIR